MRPPEWVCEGEGRSRTGLDLSRQMGTATITARSPALTANVAGLHHVPIDRSYDLSNTPVHRPKSGVGEAEECEREAERAPTEGVVRARLAARRSRLTTRCVEVAAKTRRHRRR